MTRTRLDWTNLLVVVTAHALAAVAVVYMAVVHFSWWTLGLAVVWFVLCNLAISGGYHRLFAHRSYKAARPLRLLYLLFGAGAVQNSALKWSADHRVHHAFTDTEEDPYNIRRGFWWAHIGWVVTKSSRESDPSGVNDLAADPLVAFQHRYYVVLAGLFGAVLPFSLGFLWGDPWGALLVAGFLRLVLQWHVTFSINSLAHYLGRQPYGTETTARDSMITALISFGEGYHNFHHRFQADYRNGVRWFDYDPTKWLVWCLGRLGVTWDLKRAPRESIVRARRPLAAGSD